MFQIDFKNHQTAATRRVETSMKEGYNYVITRIEFREGLSSVEGPELSFIFSLFSSLSLSLVIDR